MMKQFKFSLVSLVVGLAIFFNVERLDFGQQNFVDIQSFVYLFGTVAVVSLLLVPPLTRAPISFSLALWLAVFVLCKFIVFNGRPVWGGVFSYLTMTEAGLIAGLVVLAYRAGGGLQEFMEAVRSVTLEKVGEGTPEVGAAGDLVRAEMTRSRHYQRPLSVIVAAPEAEGVEVVLPALVREAERAFVRRYASARLAALMRRELRPMDTVLEDRRNGRFVILCPEVDGVGSSVLIERIRRAASGQMGVEVRCGAASFPEAAVTFEDLVGQAVLQLEGESVGKSRVKGASLYPHTQG